MYQVRVVIYGGDKLRPLLDGGLVHVRERRENVKIPR